MFHENNTLLLAQPRKSVYFYLNIVTITVCMPNTNWKVGETKAKHKKSTREKTQKQTKKKKKKKKNEIRK